jgi:hypothetical protein
MARLCSSMAERSFGKAAIRVRFPVEAPRILKRAVAQSVTSVQVKSAWMSAVMLAENR